MPPAAATSFQPIDWNAAGRRLTTVASSTWAVAGCSLPILLLVQHVVRASPPRISLGMALAALLAAELAVTLLRLAARFSPAPRPLLLAAHLTAWLNIAWITLASSSWWTVLLVCPSFLALESIWWSRHLMPRRRPRLPVVPRNVPSEPPSERPTRNRPGEPGDPATVDRCDRQDDGPDAGVLEQVTRRFRPVDGTVRIEGRLAAELAAGQRSAALHVLFCPPLAERPELNAMLCDGGTAEVRVTDVECYGARIELRRSARAAGEAGSYVVAWEAVSASERPSPRESRSI